MSLWGRRPPSPRAGRPPATDALQARTLQELYGFTDWCRRFGVAGMVGEFGWPNTGNGGGAQSSEVDLGLWNALGEVYYRALDAEGVASSQWASGRWFADYLLAVVTSRGIALSDGDVDTTRANAGSLLRRVGQVPARGTSASGASIQPSGFSAITPGALGTDYAYPTNADFAYMGSLGIRSVRLPIRWERIQPVLLAALDPAQLTALRTCLTAAGEHAVDVVLDLHNTAATYRATPTTSLQLQWSSGELTEIALLDVWARLAATLESPDVAHLTGYELLNEPANIAGGAPAWYAIVNHVIAGLRAAGSTRTCYVHGYNWATVRNWQRHQATPPVVDPADNVVYVGHHYWDGLGDASGSYRHPYAAELALAAKQGFRPE
jgi:aryl-phospho-beta-D-glucosidase BglC (GH1 family)